MSRNAKIVVALFVVLAIGLGILFYSASVENAAQTAEATATVLRAEREAQRGDDNTILILSYQAGSAVTEARARVQGVHMDEYPAGRQLRVCYDPANPSSVRLDDGPCG